MVRDPQVPEVRNGKREPMPDPDLRDTEEVPLIEGVGDYIAREVIPHVPDAMVGDPEGRIGYEIPFTRLFHRPIPPRPSEEIKAELRELESDIRRLLEETLV